MSRSAGTPASEDELGPLGDVLGRLQVVALDVDDADRQVEPGRRQLGQDVQLGHLAVGELEHQLRDAELLELLDDRPERPLRQRPAKVVAEAEVRREPDAGRVARRGRGRVEETREVGRRVGVDRGRRLVDLDERGPCLDQGGDLGGQERHERRCRGQPCRVDQAGAGGQPPGERERPRQGHPERPRRAGRGIPELLDDTQPVGCRDGLEDLEAVLLVVAARAQAASGLRGAHTRQVAIELGREEAGPSHLAVGDDVDAGLLLVADRRVHRVVQRLPEVGRPQLATGVGGHRGDQPRGVGVRADDAREDGGDGHGRCSGFRRGR